MEGADYSAFADLLSKFHTSSASIQALWLLVVLATVVGVPGCIAWSVTEIVRTLTGRRTGGVPIDLLLAGEGPDLRARRIWFRHEP
jgi:hypothetical protein